MVNSIVTMARLQVCLASGSPSHLRHPVTPHLSQQRCQLVAVVQGSNVISAADTLPVHQNVGNGPATCVLSQKSLEIRPNRVLIQLDDKRLRRDRVPVKQD